MDIVWFRDLSIAVLGLVTTVVLIFASIIIYRLYRKMTMTLSLVQILAKSVDDTVNTVEEVIKNTSQNINDTVTEVKDNIKLVSKGIGDTFTRIQERTRPLLTILAVVQGIGEGIKSISKIFKKENNEGANCNE
jgi:methyl-accepting chemotaxis protein